MFSSRTRWDTSANALSEVVARLRAEGRELYDLTESNPTRVGLGFPVAELLSSLAHAGVGRYEPEPFGLPEAREAIAGYYRSKGLPVGVERIIVSSSTSESYSWIFKLLADPGDEVLVPKPSYPLFGYLAGLESVRAVGYPLRYDGRWHVDLPALRAGVTPRTRAIVVVSPNNPTGSFLKVDELQAIAALCQEEGLALVSDEVFADYALSPDAARAPSALLAADVLVFALSGLSKVAALPQVKIGWMALAGPPPLLSAALSRLEVICDSYLSPSIPSQLALGLLLERRELAQGPIRERLRKNLDALRASCVDGAPWTQLFVEGGWSALLQVPRSLSEEDWTLALAQEGVLVHPGYFFDLDSEAFLALSLIAETRVFREGVLRIGARIRAELGRAEG